MLPRHLERICDDVGLMFIPEPSPATLDGNPDGPFSGRAMIKSSYHSKADIDPGSP